MGVVFLRHGEINRGRDVFSITDTTCPQKVNAMNENHKA